MSEIEFWDSGTLSGRIESISGNSTSSRRFNGQKGDNERDECNKENKTAIIIPKDTGEGRKLHLVVASSGPKQPPLNLLFQGRTSDKKPSLRDKVISEMRKQDDDTGIQSNNSQGNEKN